jgi:hypothetical protein
VRSTVVFAAESEKEMQEWIEAIRQVIVFVAMKSDSSARVPVGLGAMSEQGKRSSSMISTSDLQKVISSFCRRVRLCMPSCAVMRVRVRPVRCGADGVIHEQGQALGQYADKLIALRTSQSKYLAFLPAEGKLVIGLSAFFAHHTTIPHRCKYSPYHTHQFQTPLSASTACSWLSPDRRVPRATLCTCGTPPASIWL